MNETDQIECGPYNCSLGVLDVALGGALVCAVLVAGLWRYLTGAL